MYQWKIKKLSLPFLVMPIFVTTIVFSVNSEEDIQYILKRGEAFAQSGNFTEALDLFQQAGRIEPNNKFVYFNMGLLYFKIGDYPKAEENFIKVIEIDPESSGAHFNLGLVYERLDKKSDALKEYQTVISLNKNMQQVRSSQLKTSLIKGDILFSKEMFEHAKYEFLKASEIEPKNIYIHTRLGQIYFLLDEIENAKKEYEIVVKQRTDDFNVHFSLGRIYSILGMDEDALYEMETVIRLAEGSDEAVKASKEIYRLKGKIQSKSEKVDEAITSFIKFLEAEPNNIDVRFQLANAYSRGSDFAKAVEEYKKVIELDPDNIRAHLNLGIMYARLLKGGLAVKEYEKVIAIDSKSDEAYIAKIKKGFLAGLDYYRKGMMEDAIREYKSILESEQDNIVALKNLGEILIQQNSYVEAIEVYNRLIKLEPENLKFYLNIALLYESLGKESEAIEKYSYIISMDKKTDKSYQTAQKRLTISKANKLLAEKRYSDSIKIYHKLLDDSSADSLIHLKIASAYISKDMYEEAIKELKAILEISPEYINAHLYLGIAMEKVSILEEARKEYEYILFNSKDPDDVVYAKRRILVMKGDNYMEKKEYGRALKEYEAVYERDKDDLITMMKLATIYSIMGMKDDAERLLEKVIAKVPDNKIAYYNLASIYERTNDTTKALASYKKVLTLTDIPKEIDEVRYKLYMLEGKINTESGDYIWAIRNFKAASMLNPRDKGPLYNILDLYFDLNKFKEANLIGLSILEMYPSDPLAHFKMGALFATIGKYAEAITEYETALSLSKEPNIIAQIEERIALVKGDKWYREGEFDKAISEYQKILKVKPDNIFVYHKVARTFLSQNKGREAEKIYKKMIEIDPSNIYSHLNLGYLYEQINLFDEALKEYESIKELDVKKELNIDEMIYELKRRKQGFDYSMSYSMSFDNNITLSTSNPDEDFYSSYNLNTLYHRYFFNIARLDLSLSPSFSTNYLSQVTSFSLEGSPSFSIDLRSITSTIGFSYVIGFTGGSPSSTSSTISFSVARRQKFPSVASLSTAISIITSKANSAFDSTRRSIGFSIGQDIFWLGRERLSLGYVYGDAKSRLPAGKANDFSSHSANLGYNLNILRNLSTSFRFGISSMNFINPDPITGILFKRTFSSFTYTISYLMPMNTVVFITYSRNIGRSNITTAEALNISDIIANQLQEQEIIISRSAYEKDIFSIGIQMSF